ncbi:MAG TPA: peptide chain release factor N(5)-glutamine methyltransferase [Acidimicrobiales bacterium]|nr:peptide chain release factor N(5)-glutamine methyltransferase [Acidimicrobiales bacterium]
MTWRALLAGAVERVGDHDAWRILEQASGRDGAELTLALDEDAPARAATYAEELVTRRADGEPLQYVVGRWGFRSLDLMVDRRVLIPRPETEQVVEVAMEELARVRPAEGAPVVVDLGTGSGAIALSFAAEAPGAEVWATDCSPDALAVARANLAGNAGRGAGHVHLVEGAWFGALPPGLRGHVNLVVANPPYVGDGEDLPPEVADWEPRGALRSGPIGTECLFEIVDEAPAWLTRPGALVLELAPAQAPAVVEHARAAGFTDVSVHPDLAGHDRTVAARIS